MVYLREEDFKFIPTKMVKIFLSFSMSRNYSWWVEETFKYVSERAFELGKLSRRYVENWHDPIRIVDDIKVTMKGHYGQD